MTEQAIAIRNKQDMSMAARRARTLKTRRASERRFKWMGRLCVAFGLACVAFLFVGQKLGWAREAALDQHRKSTRFRLNLSNCPPRNAKS